MKRISLFLFAFFFLNNAYASTEAVKHVFVIIFENTNVGDAKNQATFSSLMKQGAFLNDYHALAHPSQPNYLALVGGDMFGVYDDNNHNINASHLGDLLEARGLNWKVYAEAYPGNCYADSKGTYVRKHEPFISFVNIQNDKARCNAHIVKADQLDADIANGTLPEYSFYVPDLNNDGHDTGVKYADNWLGKAFGPRFKDPKFMNGTIVALTFDENGGQSQNQIYTLLFGASVKTGFLSNKHYTHYNFLATVEKIFGIGNLGRNDAKAAPIDDVWN